jgi:prepilin-type N-terminal cleavage/methylation domain-containing protein
MQSYICRCPQEKRRAGVSAGFTLLELMIAMVMTVILAAAIASAFGTGLRVWERVQRQSDSHQENSAVNELLASDLRSAWLSTDGTMGSFELPEGSGNDSTKAFRFTSLLPDKENPQVSYLSVVSYRFDSSNGSLWRTVAMVTPDTTAETGSSSANTSITNQQPDEEEELVAEHVSAFSVRCWDGESWQNTWTTISSEGTTGISQLSESTQTTQVAADLGGSEPTTSTDPAQQQTTTETQKLPEAVEVTVRFEATESQPAHAVKSVVLLPMGHIK